jgi:ParB family chromosome partitioning protein
MTEKPRRLGRGLEALITGATTAATPPTPNDSTYTAPSALRDIPLDRIHANPLQPRQNFNPQELAELEASLRVSGLLQPVTVREREDGDFELIAGERRLRAATRLGWATIPAMVKPLDNRDMLVLALVENLQRADLNPLDEAMGYQRLIAEFGHTQQQVADAVGKDRSTVANLLRVLGLPEGIRRYVRDGQLSLGHARALLAMPNERAMLDAARQAVDRQLSVREVERLAQTKREEQAPAAPRSPAHPPAAPASPRTESAELRRLTELLRRRLQTDVQIQVQSDNRGTLAIAFYSPDDLHRVMELVLGHRLDAD